mgnify:FL=1
MRERAKKILFGFYSVLGTLGALMLWDIARFQLEVQAGVYDLPFGITLPWYIAGDIAVTMVMISILFSWFVD